MFGVSVDLAIIGADHGLEDATAQRWRVAAAVALAGAAMAAIRTAAGRPGAGQLREGASRARRAGVRRVLRVGLCPGLDAVWAMVLVTAICTGEVLSDLFAANPEFLSTLSASLRVEDDS